MRKAQAAMEFLMTYGWAILVVLVAIAALAYFGVLNPGRFIPSACMITGGVSCIESKIASGNATIILQNNMGKTLTVVAVSLEGACTTTNSTTMADEAQVYFTCQIPSGTPGSKYKHNFNVTYNSENGLPRTLTGSVSGQYE